jgi:type I restriction enzyme S subunit
MECGGNDAALAGEALGFVPENAPSSERVEEAELPEGWRTARLDEVVQSSRPLRGSVTGTDSRIPFIPMALLPNDGLPTTRWEMRSAEEVRSGVPFAEGDVLLAKITPCLENGKLGVASGIPGGWGMTSTEVYPLRAERVTTEFLASFLTVHSVRHALASKMQGATGRQRLPKEALDAFPIPVPPPLEQRAIATVLRTVQGAKEACERVLAATRQLKQSLLHHIFTYGPVSFPQAAHVPLKETEYGSVPKAWDVVELKDAVTEIDYGLSAPIPKMPPKGGTNIVSTADITKDGRLLYSQIRQVEAPARTIARLMLKGGDLLFNWRNSPELIGKTGIFDNQLEPHIFASFILRIRTDEHRTHNLFLKQLLNHYRTSGVFLSLARRAVNQANYNRNEISILKIPLPPLSEQREIAAHLAAVDAKLAAEESRRAALAALFQSLLHHLLSGQVRVPLDCGGKRSATPLSPSTQALNMQPDDTAPENESAPPEAKAPSPLRSAGALHRSNVPAAIPDRAGF